VSAVWQEDCGWAFLLQFDAHLDQLLGATSALRKELVHPLNELSLVHPIPRIAARLE
jgi:hypothetical protein